jgi:hypothetical protein
MLNAFCRVAPSVRFSVRAILAAGVFFFASVFSSRTCTDVHARRFDAFFAIKYLPVSNVKVPICGVLQSKALFVGASGLKLWGALNAE